jgi:hypothetical protein
MEETLRALVLNYHLSNMVNLKVFEDVLKEDIKTKGLLGSILCNKYTVSEER